MSKFKLKSRLKPAGDQPEAIKKLVSGLKKGYRDQTLLGVTGSGKTFTMAKVIEQIQKPTLVISHNKTLAAQLATEFKEFFPENEVHYFVSYYDYYQPEAYIPRTDTYIEKETDINEEIERLRHAATQALLTRPDTLIVASVSCIYGIGKPEEYEKVKVSLKTDEKISRDRVLELLTAIQYERNDIEFRRGTFRIKGDILDVHPPHEDIAIRIQFFDEKVESLSKIDILTNKTIKELSEVSIYPATHWVTPQKKLDIIIKAIKKELAERVKYFKSLKKFLEAQRIQERTNYDMEMLKETGYVNGIENYSRYLEFRKPGDPPSTLIDYFEKDFLMFIDESHMTVPQIRGMYNGDRARKETLIDFGFRLPSALDNRPLKFDEFNKKINQVIYVSATPQEYERKKSAQIVEQINRPTGLLDPDIEVKPTKNQVDDLIEEIRKRVKKGQRILVTTLTKRMAEDLSEFLKEVGIKCHYLHSEINTLKRLEILRDLRQGVFDVVVGINLLREGLDLPEVSLVAILDADKESFLRDETALIQVMGRAARHLMGHIIMYADKMTGSMKRAIKEVERRRKIQIAFNKKHKITPQSIKKEIYVGRLAGEKRLEEKKIDFQKIPKDELHYLIKNLENQMQLAAANLEFEKAAKIRDQIKALRKSKNNDEWNSHN